MGQIKIYVVSSGRTISKTVNLDTETVDGLIQKMINANEIPEPPSDAGSATIWRLSKKGGGSSSLGNCIPDPGFVDGETAYLIAVPR